MEIRICSLTQPIVQIEAFRCFCPLWWQSLRAALEKMKTRLTNQKELALSCNAASGLSCCFGIMLKLDFNTHTHTHPQSLLPSLTHTHMHAHTHKLARALSLSLCPHSLTFEEDLMIASHMYKSLKGALLFNRFNRSCLRLKKVQISEQFYLNVQNANFLTQSII